MVASNCATFIIGPFIAPSAWVKARASSPLPAPASRLAPTRAAKAPALTPMRA